MSILTTADITNYTGKKQTDPDFALLTWLQPMVEQLVKDFVGYQIEQATFVEWYPDRVLSNVRDELVDGAPYEIVGGRAVQYGLLGLNAQTIQLRQLPVRSITAIHENPAAWQVANPPDFPNSTKLTEGLDYNVDWREPQNADKISWTGHVYRLTGAWYMSPWAHRTIQVTYVAGFTANEMASPGMQHASRPKLAALVSLQKFFKEMKAQQDDGVTGASGGAYSSESIAGYSINYADALQNRGLQYDLPAAAKRILEPVMRMSAYF
jgi:hypothetical protein